MNFKIYVKEGLKSSIASIDSLLHTNFTIDDFKENIDNHIASKITQNFLFFITPELIAPLHTYMTKHNKSVYQFVVIGALDDISDNISLSLFAEVEKKYISKAKLGWILAKFKSNLAVEKQQYSLSDNEIKDIIEDQNELMGISQLLSKEKDRDLLIQKILETSLRITGADAGSVFLVVDNPDGTKGLLFKYSYTFSRNIDFKEFIMPMNENSIAGFCAINDEVVNIPDVYKISESATFSFNRSIDERYDYVSKSMLVFPMKNHLGEMHGVIQLINSKENYNTIGDDETESYQILLETHNDFNTKVFPFVARYEDLMLSVAGQASVALDNINMIQQLNDQFEGMVRASVDATDSKDPATSGHSVRVAKMGVRFLKAINDSTESDFDSLHFSKSDLKQMEYAALLHDYGKIYIDNDIFLKAKKLFPKDFSILMLRLDLIIQSLKTLPTNESNRNKIEIVATIRDRVRSLNEPRIFHENPKEIIDDILSYRNEIIVYDTEGTIIPLLTEDEITNLQIGRGTLNSKERHEIESHVTYSYDFLRSIPWPKELRRIPEIAGGHHEMLNGSGYPNGLTADELCIETRVLAILDIFDALSATDRPYKKAVPFGKVHSILLDEGESGRLDKSLLNLFFKVEIYKGLYSKDSETINV